MSNLKKRILTAIVALPISIFCIISDGYFFLFFLIFILFGATHELLTAFKTLNIKIILFLFVTLSCYSIYYFKIEDPMFLYMMITISISTDIGGYIFGKIFKWKTFTKISPKKTISGVFGSFFCSVLAVHILSDFFPLGFNNLNYFEIILLIIFMSILSQAGDLFVSWCKRINKIKDTGKILPGHGGILDRVDGLLFLPAFMYILNLIK